MKLFSNLSGLFKGSVGGLVGDDTTPLQDAMRKVASTDLTGRNATYGKLKPSLKTKWDACTGEVELPLGAKVEFNSQYDVDAKKALNDTVTSRKVDGGSVAFTHLCGAPAKLTELYGKQLDVDLINVTARMGEVKRIIDVYLKEHVALQLLCAQLTNSRAAFKASPEATLNGYTGDRDRFALSKESERIIAKMGLNCIYPSPPIPTKMPFYEVGKTSGYVPELDPKHPLFEPLLAKVMGDTAEYLEHQNIDGTISMVLVEKEYDPIDMALAKDMSIEDSAGQTNPAQGSDDQWKTTNQAESESYPTT